MALLLACGPAVAADKPLGTLFHTPEERARLDRMRQGEPADAARTGIRANRITGYVQRSDGPTTVWIDGVPVPLAARKAPRLDPRSVDGDGRDAVKIERKPPQ